MTETLVARPLCSRWDGERCSLGLFGGSPSAGTCRMCTDYDGPPRGGGDVVRAVIDGSGIGWVVRRAFGRCRDCDRRQLELNEWLPIGDFRNRDAG
jgi:hypothetical protein